MDGPNEVGSLYSYASINDTAYFELSELIDHAVSAKFVISEMSPGIVIPLSGNIIKNLSVIFSDNNNQEVETSFTALKGRLTPDLFPFAGYGYTYETMDQYLSANPILSIKPSELYIYHPNQQERLYVFCKEAMNVSVTASIYLHKGGTIHQDMGAFSASNNSLYELDTSYQKVVQPHIASPDNGCSYYRIRLYSGFTPISKWYNYHVDFNTRVDGCFVFQNSLGGFDTLCPTGGLSIRSRRAQDVSQVVPTPFAKQQDQRISSLDSSIRFSRYTGNLPIDYLQFLQQLLFSPKVYWVEPGGQPLEITIADSNINIAKNTGELISAQIPYFFNPPLKAEKQ